MNGLADSVTYLNQLRTTTDDAVFAKILGQQFASWKAKLRKLRLTTTQSTELSLKIQESPFNQQQKGELLEAVVPHTPDDDLLKGQRPRQSCFCFHDFLTPSDITNLQKGSMFMRLQTVSKRMALITLHLPTEPTMGHILEFLSMGYSSMLMIHVH